MFRQIHQEKTLIERIKMKSDEKEVINDVRKYKRIIKLYYEQQYANGQLEEMDNFPEM